MVFHNIHGPSPGFHLWWCHSATLWWGSTSFHTLRRHQWLHLHHRMKHHSTRTTVPAPENWIWLGSLDRFGLSLSPSSPSLFLYSLFLIRTLLASFYDSYAPILSPSTCTNAAMPWRHMLHSIVVGDQEASSKEIFVTKLLVPEEPVLCSQYCSSCCSCILVWHILVQHILQHHKTMLTTRSWVLGVDIGR